MLYSIERRLDETAGVTSGWDYMRLSLAIGVMLAHSVTIAGGKEAFLPINPYINKIFLSLLIPMFFCLSGFLVARSLNSVSLPVFVGLRFLRIFPALVVEVTLSALILGTILTKFDLLTYFTSGQFYEYFQNLIGIVKFQLPGVFHENPLPKIVNGSLWTVPFELQCYIALTLLAAIGIAKYWQAMLAALASMTAYNLWFDTAVQMKAIDGRMLVLYFLAGVTFYLMRKLIPLSIAIFIACVALSSWLFLSPLFYEFNFYYFAPIPVAYCTVYLGLLTPPKAPIIFSGDYSYGMYLYAFPIQQTVALALAGTGWLTWYYDFGISLIIVSCFAAFSWFAIERPILRLKKLLLGGHLDIREREFVKYPLPGKNFPGNSPEELADRASG